MINILSIIDWGKTVKFSTDELMPFFEVRTSMSKHLDNVQIGKEIIITRHGKPEGALISAAQLYRYRELERIFNELTALLETAAPTIKPDSAQKALLRLISETHNVPKATGAGKR